MGFALKKLLSTLLMPLSIGLILFIVGLIFLYVSKYKKAKFFLTLSFLWIIMVSYSPFSNAILSPLESEHSKLKEQVSAKYVLLLGGDFKGRSHEAVKLYHQIPNAKLITSGYPGSEEISEARSSRNKLIELGIPQEDILMQEEPKDTQEEAINIKNIVGTDAFILVTAASHMPRALALFKKEGLNPIVAPTNHLAKMGKFISFPSAKNLQKSGIAFHEYLGKWWNKIKEYKKELLN